MLGGHVGHQNCVEWHQVWASNDVLHKLFSALPVVDIVVMRTNVLVTRQCGSVGVQCHLEEPYRNQIVLRNSNKALDLNTMVDERQSGIAPIKQKRAKPHQL